MPQADWTHGETSLAVEAYMAMAEALANGIHVNKSQLYRGLATQTGHSSKAIEFKMLNVSGALAELGFGVVPGLLPARRYQTDLSTFVQQALDRHPAAAQFLKKSEQTMSSPEETPSSSENSINVADLWELATGGAEVAVRPGAQPRIRISGPRPAGVDAATSWLSSALQNSGALPHYLFLVGGPGGGKSRVATEVVTGFPRLDDQDAELAHRQYRYQAPSGAGLCVINDATIPEADDAEITSTLAGDLTAASSAHVLACVNRGVLVDERLRERADSHGTAVTRWLRNEVAGQDQWVVTQDNGDAYFSTAVLEDTGKPVARLCRVYVDSCSLFEAQPDVTSMDGRLVPSPYRVAEFEAASGRADTPAGKLLSTVTEALSYGSPRGDWDPVAANLQTLRAPRAREAVLQMLRAAELRSSQKFSYRQVWGTIARLVAGGLPESIAADDLGSWLDARNPYETDSPRGRFEAFQSLAEVRLHQALYGKLDGTETRHPILGATNPIDPALELRPGLPNDETTGWATPCLDAFDTVTLGKSPLSALLDQADSQPLAEFVTEFDREVDKSYVAAQEGVQDLQWQAEAASWYGTYLARLLGTATSNPALLDEIQAWTRLWHKSPVVPDEYPDKLRTHLLDLLRPTRVNAGGDRVSQVPLYTSRVTALVDRPTSPQLTAQLAPMKLSTTKDGEDLQLQVLHEETLIGQMVLNIDLLREALVTGNGWLGLTDSTENTIPRLERLRALTLMAANPHENSIVLVSPTFEEDVAMETQP